MVINLFAFAVWGWFSFAFYVTDNAWLAREFRLISVTFQSFAQLISLYFAYAYARQVRVLAWWEKIFCGALAGLTAVCTLLLIFDGTLGTQLVMGEVFFDAMGKALTPSTQTGFHWLFTSFLLLAPVYGIVVWRSVLLQQGVARRSGLILLVTVVAAYLMGATGFLAWYEISGPFTLLRSLALPLFFVGAFYSITSYRLFNIRIGAASLFIFAIWAFMFLRVLLHPTLQSAYVDIAILLAFIAVGLLLIRNVTREFAVRLRLEEVSSELKQLNGSLENKVASRTRELSQSRAHTEAVVEHLPVGLVEVNRHGTIVRINKIASGLFGVQSTVVVNTPLLASKPLSQVFKHQLTPGVFDAAIVSPGKREVEVTVAPLVLEEGEGYVAIVHDVTDAKALERAKGEFVSTAAHQLRTPLAALKWVFNLLQGDTLTKEQHEVVERGASGVANMERITEGLLMSVRTSEGVASYKFAPTDLVAVIKNAEEILQPVATKKKIRFITEVPAGLPMISLDAERMMFAIQNLIDNAIKYTLPGGEVKVVVVPHPKEIEVRVSDSGIGISQNDQEHLFEKFFRTKRAVELFTDGSGLGLFIVKSIVEAHGGRLQVQSEEGKGSVFALTIPIIRS